MEIPLSPGAMWARRPRLQCRGITAAVVVATLLLVAGDPALADPEGGASPQAKLERLEKRADHLAEDYRGQLVQLDDTKRTATRAVSRARSAQRQLRRAQRQVAELAAEKYKHGGVAPGLSVLMSRDPQAVLDRAATIDYLARKNSRQITTMRDLLAEARKARRSARARVADVRRQLERMEKNRQRVQQLIERYEARAAARAENAASPSPSSPDNVTARMAAVYAEVVSKFGTDYGVHCYRPDDSGEHPEGRACDFMLSSAGSYPSGSQVERGYEIAEWAQANAERLGIMYIIYRQRIWDVRCGCGWESMEDRGSVTANHIDHVHISVF